ncbi:MAG: leucyl/phenylalanyl-tRNA--protein transferase [Bacteroidales bacterium]|nr:leucyl/phenylalanyl-tRNA--protein transferase [Bacteroidales bacterium]
MIYSLASDYYGFPDPAEAEENGLIAVGGDLSPQRLVEAYASGIFPWPIDDHSPLLWFSLDPRMVLWPERFIYSHSLRRTVRSGRFEVRVDTCFEQVVRGCATADRHGQDGTWIIEDMVQAYVQLHELGLAHSFETFCNGQLVGGLYGVSLGNMFSGESMFHLVRDASKVAFVRLVEFASLHGFCMIDAQQPTSHLASLGATPIPRHEFLQKLDGMDFSRTLQGTWGSTVVLLLGSNQGDRHALLDEAIRCIGHDIGWSSLRSARYETSPWGFECDTPFINQALVVETSLSPNEVLSLALAIEHRLGRQRPSQSDSVDSAGETRNYAPRPIDIDLMFYDSRCIDTPRLQLPHPRLHLRRFALQPLCDLCPNFVHPRIRKTLAQLLEQCPDTGEVTKLA